MSLKPMLLHISNAIFPNTMTEVHISETVYTNTTNISNMFINCSNLTNVSGLENLVNYTDGQHITNISRTFQNCSNLINAPVIPNSITSISETFNGCIKLVNAPTIPNSVIDMSGTFQNCTNLVNAPVIPNSVTNMMRTFQKCTSFINTPTIPKNTIDMDGTFLNCTNLTKAPVIPNGVLYIANTFSECTNLTEAPVIPESVIDMYLTFQNCINLTGNIYIFANEIVTPTRDPYSSMWSYYGTFSYNLNGIYDNVLPKNVYMYANTNTWKTFKKYYRKDSFLYKNANNQYVTIENVASDGQGYFTLKTFDFFDVSGWNCTDAATYTNIYNYVGTSEHIIVPSTLNNKTSMLCLTNTTFPNFTKNITIQPNTYVNISNFNGIFSNQINLKEIHNFDNLSLIDNGPISFYWSFDNCSNLTSFSGFPKNTTDLTYAFFACYNLSQIENIPNTVTRLTAAFERTNFINAPVIPNSVTDMTRTFTGCTNLINAPAIPNSVTSMSYTFSGCTNLKNAPTIPESVTDMSETFSGCTNLVNAPVIPNNVTTLKYLIKGTFSDCVNLTGNIYIYSNIIDDAGNVFSDTSLTKNVYIHPNTNTWNAFNNAYGSGQCGVVLKELV